MALPWTHLSPASITLHFELSIITGTREISGSLAIRFKKRVIASGRIEHGLVHVDVDDLRAVFDLLARHADSLLELVVQDQPRERLRSGHVRALADIDEQAVIADLHWLQARQLEGAGEASGIARGGNPSIAAAMARM